MTWLVMQYTRESVIESWCVHNRVNFDMFYKKCANCLFAEGYYIDTFVK